MYNLIFIYLNTFTKINGVENFLSLRYFSFSFLRLGTLVQLRMFSKFVAIHQMIKGLIYCKVTENRLIKRIWERVEKIPYKRVLQC